jgi:hypothetical protein
MKIMPQSDVANSMLVHPPRLVLLDTYWLCQRIPAKPITIPG